VAYVGANPNLYAFDATGKINCSGFPETCAPLWSASLGEAVAVQASPAVGNGVVYIGSSNFNLYAFDAAGVLNCSGAPKTCSPLWSVTLGDVVYSSPAVANGFVYVGSFDGKLYAFHLP
jgi:outer membrane protein assembly factor BamB